VAVSDCEAGEGLVGILMELFGGLWGGFVMVMRLEA
jgi:hypothetical protein